MKIITLTPDESGMVDWPTLSNDKKSVLTIGSFDGPACYCIEPGVPRNLYRSYESYGEDYWDTFPAEYNRVPPWCMAMRPSMTVRNRRSACSTPKR